MQTLTTAESHHVAQAFNERFYWRVEQCPAHFTNMGSVRLYGCAVCALPTYRMNPGDEIEAERRYWQRCDAFEGYFALSFDPKRLHRLINVREELHGAIRRSRMFDDCRRDAPWRNKS
jgi:hypothetical protein